MKMWWLLILVVLADFSGNLFIARGMRRMGEVVLRRPMDLLRLVPRVVTNPTLGAGICCMTVAFFAFLTLLSWANLSFVLPATALGYVANTVGASFILKENVTAERWLGTLLIGIGVALISLSPAS